MGTRFMVTVTGTDRSGLLKRLADKTHEHEGRWLDSKTVHLDGLIAGIVKIDTPAEQADRLKAELNAMDGIQVVFAEPAEAHASPAQQMRMTVEAADRPDIVGDINRLLTNNGVAIEDMSSQCFSVPNLSETVFRGSFSLLMPDELDRDSLIEELESLCDGNIRIALKAENTD